MGSRANEVHQFALNRVDQQEIAADMALAMIAPIALEGGVQPFRAKRRIVGEEQHHRFLELVHVVAAAARQPIPILDEPLFVGCLSWERSTLTAGGLLGRGPRTVPWDGREGRR